MRDRARVTSADVARSRARRDISTLSPQVAYVEAERDGCFFGRMAFGNAILSKRPFTKAGHLVVRPDPGELVWECGLLWMPFTRFPPGCAPESTHWGVRFVP